MRIASSSARPLSSRRSSTAMEGGDEPLVRVLRDEPELPLRLTAGHHVPLHRRRDLLRGRVDRPDEESLLLAAPDGEHAVRRQVAQRLREVVVVLELRDLLLLPGGDLAPHHAAPARQLAHAPAQVGVFRHALGEDVARPLERVADGGDLLRGVDVGRGRGLGVGVRRGARPEQVGERLQPALAGDHRARAALRLEGEIEVLEHLLGLRALDPCAQLVGELPLLVHRLQDRGATLLQLRQVFGAVAHVAELDLVEGARDLLPVAGDEGERVPLVEQGEGAGDLAGGERELDGDLLDEVLRPHGGRRPGIGGRKGDTAGERRQWLAPGVAARYRAALRRAPPRVIGRRRPQ
jgi:hypothetical protein